MISKNDPGFFIATMPDTRPADYYLGCYEGEVYMDFENCNDKRIRLIRISFDGYGCCKLNDQAIPMNDTDSRAFRKIFKEELIDQSLLTTIVMKTILSNRNLIWEEALIEYGLS